LVDEERNEIFALLESLKLKPGETLRTSYFKKGGKEPLYISTVKIDGAFTLYRVEGKKLTKVQTANNPHTLEELILPELK
jgi:hypothetical protein